MDLSRTHGRPSSAGDDASYQQRCLPLLSGSRMGSQHEVQGNPSISKARCEGLCVSPPQLTLQSIEDAGMNSDFMYPSRIILVIWLAIVEQAGHKLVVRARIATSAH